MSEAGIRWRKRALPSAAAGALDDTARLLLRRRTLADSEGAPPKADEGSPSKLKPLRLPPSLSRAVSSKAARKDLFGGATKALREPLGRRLRRVRCLRGWFVVWDSAPFWKVKTPSVQPCLPRSNPCLTHLPSSPQIFPWVLSVLIMGVANFFCLWVALKVFDSTTVVNWAQSVSFSMLAAWGIQEPVVILIRNNLVCTRTVVRSSRYQTFEKVIVGPIVKVINELTS